MSNREEIYRLARKPDPWAPLDWAWAELDGTFGNRYDDAESRYRVLYASSQRLGCYLETLARFRPDPTLATELNQIEGENDFYPLGQVPAEWFGARLLAQFGIHDLDQAVLQAGAPRKLTQMVSRAIFNAGLDGIRYPSKYGSAIENWALFEPFKIEVKCTDLIALDDPDLARALQLLRLAVG